MTLALIDGDVVAYLACESRWRNNKDQVVVLLDKSQKLFTKEEDRAYLEKTWLNFRKMTEEICDAVYADEFLMAVKSPTNFRDDMYPLYKANRHKDPSKMNHFVPTIRQLAVMEDFAIEATGREADDLLRIWAEQARAAGDQYVIVSNDKDLKCIPGKHYNLKTNKFLEVSEHAAMRFYYQQLLMGDPTDNIPGVPKVGPIKAEAYLNGMTTEEEMQDLVVEQYMNAYGKDWRQYLLSNGKMIHLQKHEDDYFTLDSWPMTKGLVYEAAKISTVSAAPQSSKLVKAPSPALKPSPFTGSITPKPKELTFPSHPVIPNKIAVFSGVVPKC